MVQFNLSGDTTAYDMMIMGNDTTMKQENGTNEQLSLAHALLKNVTKLMDTMLNQNQ